MLARMFEVTAPRVERCQVVARRRIVGSAGNAPLVGIDRHVAEAIRPFLIVTRTLKRAEFLVQLDQRPLPERVIAAGQLLQLAPVLHVRQIVVAA